MSKKTRKKRTPPARSNRVLLRSLSNGDGDAITEIYKRYFGRVFNEAYSLLRDVARATDVSQHTFELLLTHCREVTNPGAWLSRTAHTRALNVLRDEKLHDEKLRSLHQWLAGADEDVDSIMALRIDVSRLYDLAYGVDDRLGVPDREALKVMLAEDSVVDMALKLGIPESTMRDLRRRLLDTLRRLLQVDAERERLYDRPSRGSEET